MFYNPFRKIKDLEFDLGITTNQLNQARSELWELRSKTHEVSVACVGCENLLEWETDKYGYTGTEYGCKLNNTCPDRKEK